MNCFILVLLEFFVELLHDFNLLIVFLTLCRFGVWLNSKDFSRYEESARRLGIPAEYRELRWLLSPLRREKGGLPQKEEIKQIKDEALARPIAAVEPAANEGGKKRSSSPACEPSD